jgi:predicted ATP-grasp superfamily ATP-dependent carboligase
VLLGQFDWQGVAMVEFKVEANTGTPYLLEVNGRFWGSLQLAIDAGVDFPALLVDAATGKPPAQSHGYWPEYESLVVGDSILADAAHAVAD